MTSPFPMSRLRHAFLLLATPAAAFAQAHLLVDNFSAALPSSEQITSSVDTGSAKVGLASGRLDYRFPGNNRPAMLDIDDVQLVVPGGGVLKVWVKGDASGNQLELATRHGRPDVQSDGRRIWRDGRFISLPKVTLDFEGWRELSFDVDAIPEGHAGWLARLMIHPTGVKEGKATGGTIWLDDMRFYPTKNAPNAASAVGLMGETMREFGGPVGVFLDLRNFTAGAAKVTARVIMMDRNENLVAEREFEVALAAKESKETLLDLAPENLGAFLPPFKITGDVLSSELASVATRLEDHLVIGNSRYLYDNMGDVYGRWFTVGAPNPVNDRNWMGWVQGEAQRATPLVQTTASISRVDIKPADGMSPAAKHGLRIDFTGDATVFSSRQRTLPGNAYRAGFWVKGDGSGAKLSGLFLDLTNGADTNNRGWRRNNDGLRDLAVLDFTDWRYVEVDLPGRGVGANTPNGTTEEIDFPLELSALILSTDKTKTGSVIIGPIQVFTQQSQAGMLSVQIAADDAWANWKDNGGATITVQNSTFAISRKTKANWSLLDRAGDPIATGQTELNLPAGETGSFRIDFAKYAAEAAKHDAPYTVQVAAYDTADGSVSTTRSLILSRPDSQALVTDFEADRGYLGLKGREINNAPPVGETAAHTTDAQAHGGKRSLLINWDQKDNVRRFVSIDPALPGVPVDLTVWVHGDGSGVLFYPLIGDRLGISHGLPNAQWNLFLPRTVDGPLQNAVKVDWTGWREVTFKLPVIAPNWTETVQSLGFVPNYPLGVHLAVDATNASKPTGQLFVDDLSVNTHLAPAARVDLTYERTGESNLHTPGTPVQVVIANRDAKNSRSVTVSGGLFDWRGKRVAGIDETFELTAGARREVTLAKDFPPGFYLLKATMTGPKSAPLASIEEDVLVADPVAIFGKDWADRITSEWELRKPVGERFSFVDEDWDWVEYHPGNLQLDTVRDRAGEVSSAGSDPYMLIGYSAYWAAGPGFEQLKAGTFDRMLRDRGHAVNTFIVPERLDDWDNYVSSLMRGASKDVGGWVIWDGPDGTGPMAMTAEKFTPFLKSADKWRRLYDDTKPLIVGGLAKDTAIGYVAELGKQPGALEAITGVNVRLDVGRLSPEDARVVGYGRELAKVLNPDGVAGDRNILLTDLDWAVEKDGTGLDAFDQAAYLARTALLLDGSGIRSALTVRNGDHVRLGFGLSYRRDLLIPPLAEKPLAYQLKPAWWAMSRVRDWLGETTAVAGLEVQDIIPGRSRGLVRKAKDGSPVAILWRNDNPGQISFAGTGLKVTAAEDIFGATVPVTDGWYAVGKIPCRFTLTETDEPAALALARLQVRDGAEALWPQRVLAAFTPATGARQSYAQTGGEPAELAGRTADGDNASLSGLTFAKGGSERFQVAVPAGASLVLRKHYLLGEAGQQAEVSVNGKPAGTWDLRRSEAELSGGLREGIFVIDATQLAGQPKADIEVRYTAAANTGSWQAFELRAGEFPLSAVGPLHADQNVGSPRFARNIVGASLKVGTQEFANGIGVFARSLLEFPINGQFKRFTAKVGVDAATDGRGSVVFEVYGDGKKLWSSPTMSGLDAPKEIDVDVSGINRLRLVVTDGGDGNKFDVAVWSDPVLNR